MQRSHAHLPPIAASSLSFDLGTEPAQRRRLWREARLFTAPAKSAPASTAYIYNRCRSNILLLFDPADPGRHGGLPLRLMNRILFILQPSRRIAGGIFPDAVHIGIVSNNPFVIIALPSKFGMAAVVNQFGRSCFIMP